MVLNTRSYCCVEKGELTRVACSGELLNMLIDPVLVPEGSRCCCTLCRHQSVAVQVTICQRQNISRGIAGGS